jgi:hypothetical protein
LDIKENQLADSRMARWLGQAIQEVFQAWSLAGSPGCLKAGACLVNTPGQGHRQRAMIVVEWHSGDCNGGRGQVQRNYEDFLFRPSREGRLLGAIFLGGASNPFIFSTLWRSAAASCLLGHGFHFKRASASRRMSESFQFASFITARSRAK